MNVMLTKIWAKKGIELFKERAVADIVKEYTQIDAIILWELKPSMCLLPKKVENHLELCASSRRNYRVNLKGKRLLMVEHRGDTYPDKTLNIQPYT